MTWFPAAAAGLGIVMLFHEVYSMTWRPAGAVAGTYEKRQPGEFARDGGKYLVEALPDPREFRFLPPAPETAGLLRFSSPRRATIYVDGRPVGSVSVCQRGGCDMLIVEGVVFTKADCPL